MGSGVAERALPLSDPARLAQLLPLGDESLAVQAAMGVVHGFPRSLSCTSDWIWNATDSAA